MKKRLRGPRVPVDFHDDGCSAGAPDGYWDCACRVHDYQYHLIRPIDQYLNGDWDFSRTGKPVRHTNGLRHRLLMPGYTAAEKDKLRIEVGKWANKLNEKRFEADAVFRMNLERIHTERRLKMQSRWRRWLSKLWTARMSRVYFFGVWMGGGGAVHGPGHPKNFAMLASDTRRFRRLVPLGKEEEFYRGD